MIQLPPQLRIMLCYEPVDFRQGIDTLAALCRNRFDQDPFSGAVFLFRNRRATASESHTTCSGAIRSLSSTAASIDGTTTIAPLRSIAARAAPAAGICRVISAATRRARSRLGVRNTARASSSYAPSLMREMKTGMGCGTS